MKKKQRLFSVFFIFSALFTTVNVSVADNLRLPDMRSIGTGGNGVIQTPFINPAVLPIRKERSCYFHYYNPYGLQELGTVSGSFHYPNRWLSAGVQFSSFGYEAYRKTMFRLVSGKQLGERWSLGIGVQYVTLQTELYDEQQSRLSTDIGVLFTASDHWQMGVAVLHAPSVSLGDKAADSKQLTPFSFHTGFGWKIIDPMTLLGSVIATKENIRVETGIEYTLFDAFFIRAGIRTDPLLPSFGLGYTYSLFTIDVAAVSHPVLGMQTGIGLTLSF